MPLPVLYILHQLRQKGYDAYVVGGAVRDLLLQQAQAAHDPDLITISVTDFDFTTNARPEQIQAIFPDCFYENTFGTVSVTHENLLQALHLPPPTRSQPQIAESKIIDVTQATKLHQSLSSEPVIQDQVETFPDYQITTYRSDEVYDDFRRPTSMNWGDTLEQDLERRDFTINAMALHIPDVTLTELLTSHSGSQLIEVVQYDIIDPFHGQRDLNQELIRCVGQAETRFQEDALRMLRAIRFSVQLNMQIDESTFQAITTKATLIQHISAERVRDEFLKILKSDFPAEGIEILDEAGLLPFIMPELLEAKGVEQAGHHTTDVWVHSLDALRYTPSKDPIVRLATLIHDIGKPRTQRHQNGSITFYNHEIVGARMAEQICERLKLPRRECQRIVTLVRHHMFHYQPDHTDAAIRRFMRKVGLQNIDDILALREGDRLGSGARHTSWRLEEMKHRMQSQLHQPFAITDLAIDGTDLMQGLQLSPGPQVGRLLKTLFEEVLEKPELNDKNQLLELARQKLQSFT